MLLIFFVYVHTLYQYYYSTIVLDSFLFWLYTRFSKNWYTQDKEKNIFVTGFEIFDLFDSLTLTDLIQLIWLDRLPLFPN